jgi:hypothetical protein
LDKLHFINPEYLWGLLFLLIPIIVHFFNFRKAKVVFFTRVDLLKEVKTQKRKFSSLKKRLILLSRLLAIFFFVLATASPYISETNLNEKSNKATFLYLDNSFSMQAKFGDLTLLDLAKKTIKKNFGDFSNASQVYLVNNKSYVPINSEKELMLELSKIDFGYQNFSTLKAKSIVATIAEDNFISDFNTLVYSDFSEGEISPDSIFADVNITRVPLFADEQNNISVDSLWIQSVNVSDNKFTLGYKISNFGNVETEFHESIKFEEKVQQSLTRTIKSASDTILEIKINIPVSKKANGIISIQDGNIWYDNDLYFSVDFNKKSKILFVGNKSSKRLNYILNDDFVELSNTSHSVFKNQNLSDFDFIIYSVSKNYSKTEVELLKAYLSNGKEILLMPSGKTSSSTYGRILKDLKIGRVVNFNSKEISITEINYKNHFFDDIFNSAVENFEYPTVKGNFKIRVAKPEKLLNFENGSPFLVKSKNVFLFTSDILSTEKPFVETNLALPILYKMASRSMQKKLYERVGDNSIVELKDIEKVSIKINQELLKLRKVSSSSFELPVISKAGSFDLYAGDEIVENISYNYKRAESKQANNVEESISESRKYEELKNQSNVIYLWKWCITFTLAFLIIEMLLISFLKEKNIKTSE